jgi:hypothetical protein
MKKSNPIGVRFDLEKLEIIKKEQNLKSAQAVVNYFMDNYQSISTSKTLLEIIDLKDEPNILAIGSNFDFKLENGTSTAKTNIEPPLGLKGMDLMIWKSQNQK